MMKQEFEQLAGYEVSFQDYTNIIEPMYMAVNLTKAEFVKTIDKKRFALPTKAELKRKMRKIANEIFEGCGLRSFWEEEQELDRIAKEYARRFYGIDWCRDLTSHVLILKDYGYCGARLEIKRGCTFPETILIGRDGVDYEKIVLIA